MIERLARNPLALAGAFVASALLGAAAFALIQLALPGVAGDRAQVERIVRAYLLEHPEVLPEAMNRLREREIAERERVMAEAPKAIAANRAAITEPYAGAMQGNPKGDVTVAAYLDYNCGYCRASLPAIAELAARDPNVRIVYREYPVLGPQSVVAARWALAAAEQGRFLPFHKAVYEQGTDAEAIARAAKAAGLDTAKAAEAVGKPRVQHEIGKNLKIAKTLGSGEATPFWVIGDRVLAGLVDYDTLAAAVSEARKGK